MERSGTTPPGALAAPDLAELVRHPGPFASVYLVAEGGIDNAAPRLEARWKTQRGELEAAGAPGDLLERMDEPVTGAHRSGDGLALVASSNSPVHIEHSPEPPVADRAAWAPLPSLVPILAWRQSSPTCLAVLADRSGADLVVLRSAGPDVHREAGGDDHPMTKSAPGGWSQARFQRRAEQTWEHNAGDVADQLAELVERFAPRLVAVGGDVRAVELLQGAVPPPLADRIQVIDGSRSADGGVDQVATEVDRLVDAAVEADTAGLVAKFAEERGQSDRAAEGPGATLAALAAGQVEVLLVEHRPDDDRLASFGSEDPALVALDPGDLEAMGVTDGGQAPLADVAVRAALGTGAGIRIVPADAGLEGGIGAILRWAS